MALRKPDFVLSDVDGTLLIPGQRLPSAPVQAAARALRRNNIPLLAVTGRSHALMQRLVEPLDLRDNLCTLDGGATVAHADTGEVVWSQWLSDEHTRGVVRSISGLCLRVHFDTASRGREPAEVLAMLESEERLAAGTPSVFAIFGTERGTEVIAALAELTDIHHTPIMQYEDDPTRRCIQVVAPGVDKQFGIEQMVCHAGLSDRAPLILGDNTNDLAAFAAAGEQGVKVAMGNATDELKDAADWVAPSVHDDGAVRALERYGLI